jgi:uncharacterized coiled-coil DUF342 family protein
VNTEARLQKIASGLDQLGNMKSRLMKAEAARDELSNTIDDMTVALTKTADAVELAYSGIEQRDARIAALEKALTAKGIDPKLHNRPRGSRCNCAKLGIINFGLFRFRAAA